MKFIIIGGDAAGMSAAMQIVRNSEGHSITTLEKGSIYSYGQCGLPYVIGGKIESTKQLIARTKETFQQKYGIDAKTLHEVTKVDPVNKKVEGIDLRANKPFQVHYDRLLIATGAEPVIPKWEGVQLDGVFPLKTIPDAEKIMSYMGSNVKKVTVIGGGYIGLEMAENFAAQDLAVTMIERNEQLAKIFDPDMGELILEEAKRNGIEVKFGETVEGFSGKERVEKVVTDKGTYDTDLVLIAIGVKPNSDFLKDTGIFTERNGAISVNSYMQTNLDDVFAAGDCATQFHRIKEVDDYIPLGTHANKQGQIAGLNMINYPKTFKGVLGTSILKFFDLSLGKTGLSEREAREFCFPYESVKITTTDIAGYYPNDKPLTVKLVFHTKTYKLLGGQVIGANGVDKRIDVLATALYHCMSITELLDLDLAYAPPFNNVWDPIQQAARKANR